jgi:hypothetical protein
MHFIGRPSQQSSRAPGPRPRDPICRAMSGSLGLLMTIAFVEWMVLASCR